MPGTPPGRVVGEPHGGTHGERASKVARTLTTGVPVRTCVGCRSRRPQATLVRVVGIADRSLGVGRRLPGRGAWLCAGSVGCFEEAVRRRALARALRMEVTPEALAGLRATLGLGTAPVQVCEDR